MMKGKQRADKERNKKKKEGQGKPGCVREKERNGKQGLHITVVCK